MKVDLQIPAKVGKGLVPLPPALHDPFVEAFSDLERRHLAVTATNRLKPGDYQDNSYFRHMNDLVLWRLTPTAIVASITTEAGGADERDARATLHWLEVAWALGWTAHQFETLFARPLRAMDVTVTLDPVRVVTAPVNHPFVSVGNALVCVPYQAEDAIPAIPDLGALPNKARAEVEQARTVGRCACRLCTYARPRIEKWGEKRPGLSELYRRIGEGESVSARELLPLVGAEALKAAGKKPPSKAAMLSADEAKAWLALNPNRVF